MFLDRVLVWNCWGIVNTETQQALLNIVQAQKPSLIFLCETLASQDHIDALTRSVGFKGNYCFPCQHESQGVALLWNEETHVELRSRSAHHIDVEIGKPDDPLRWRFTGLYGWANRRDRHRTWSLIKALAAEGCSLPWLMAGDFNEILYQKDKSGGLPRASAPMIEFRRVMASCGLTDMGFSGSRFTWSNSYTKERLDMGFRSEAWRRSFPWSRLLVLKPSDSDHLPLLIEVATEKQHARGYNRPFRFEEGWHGNPQCFEIIQKHFATPTTGNPIHQLSHKIKQAGVELTQWHLKDFNRQKEELKIVQDQLNVIMNQPFAPVQYEQQRQLHVKLSQLLAQQEKYWRQRSKIIWLKEGDRNSAYFHRRASSRKSKNTIRSLNDEQGVWRNDPADVERLLQKYFQKVFSSDDSNIEALQQVIQVVPQR